MRQDRYCIMTFRKMIFPPSGGSSSGSIDFSSGARCRPSARGGGARRDRVVPAREIGILGKADAEFPVEMRVGIDGDVGDREIVAGEIGVLREMAIERLEHVAHQSPEMLFGLRHVDGAAQPEMPVLLRDRREGRGAGAREPGSSPVVS